jgi:hypothetical protein
MAPPEVTADELTLMLTHYTLHPVQPVLTTLSLPDPYVLKDTNHRSGSLVIETVHSHHFSSANQIYMGRRPFVFEWTTNPRPVFPDELRGSANHKGEYPVRSLTYIIQPLTTEQLLLIKKKYIIGIYRKLSSNMFIYCFELQQFQNYIKTKLSKFVDAHTVYQIVIRVIAYPTKKNGKNPKHRQEYCLYVWHHDYTRIESDKHVVLRGIPYQFYGEHFQKGTPLEARALTKVLTMQISNLEDDPPVESFIGTLHDIPGFDLTQVTGVIAAEHGTEDCAYYQMRTIQRFPIGPSFYVVFTSSLDKLTDKMHQSVIEYLMHHGHPNCSLERQDALPGRQPYYDVLSTIRTLPPNTGNPWAQPQITSSTSTISTTSTLTSSVPSQPDSQRQKMTRLNSPPPRGPDQPSADMRIAAGLNQLHITNTGSPCTDPLARFATTSSSRPVVTSSTSITMIDNQPVIVTINSTLPSTRIGALPPLPPSPPPPPGPPQPNEMENGET